MLNYRDGGAKYRVHHVDFRSAVAVSITGHLRQKPGSGSEYQTCKITLN